MNESELKLPRDLADRVRLLEDHLSSTRQQLMGTMIAFIIGVLAVVASVGHGLAIGPAEAAQSVTSLNTPIRMVGANGRLVCDVVADQQRSSLRLYDPQGRKSVVVNANRSGGGLVVMDAAGRVRGEIVMGQQGPALALRDASERPALVAEATDKGVTLSSFSRSGKPLAALTTTQLGGAVSVTASASQSAALIKAAGSSATIALRDGKGNSTRLPK